MILHVCEDQLARSVLPDLLVEFDRCCRVPEVLVDGRKEEVQVEPLVTEAAAAPEEVEGVEAPADIETSTLDPIAGAAAALDAAEPTPPAAPGIQPAAEPEQPVRAAARPSSSLEKPFIQIGIFSVEDNAQRTANRMRDAGIVPLTKTFERDGKTFWRVVVGPASSSAERGTLLKKVKEEGFTDAYAVTN